MTDSEFCRRASQMDVLYVEDSPTMRHATEKLLKTYFPKLSSAADGAEALELYRQFHIQNERNFNIVITDLEMPNMDGRELSRLILKTDPEQPIIIISSNENFQELIDLMNLGVKKFLSKPLQKEQLQDVLKSIVDFIYHRQLQEQEIIEVNEHNLLLKKKEEIYLEKLEKNLQVLSEFNNALNESSIVSKTDINGIITYVNERFCTLSGYTSEELIGHSHNIVKSNEFISSYYEKLWRTISKGQSYKGILKNRSKNGSYYYVDILIKPIVNTKGKIVEFISIAHDMTPLMNALENEQKAHLQKDQFFNNISHEMRTPLNAILGLISLIKRRFENDPKLYEMINIIEQSGKNLHQLIESVLDIQKIQQGQFELVENNFEPSSVLQKLAEEYEHKAQEKHQILSIYFDPNIPGLLIGDTKYLVQAIAAVLDNAIKFTPKKGNIDFSVTYEKPLLICQIQDDGIGIAKENHAQIFTLAQLDGSVSRKYEGAGLGLVLANAIIKKMGGNITVHSQLGQGATFLLEIPLKTVS